VGNKEKIIAEKRKRKKWVKKIIPKKKKRKLQIRNKKIRKANKQCGKNVEK
jgi:hypothetical protein